MLIPSMRDVCSDVFGARAVATELQKVCLRLVICARRRARSPDFQHAVVQWNGFPRCAGGIAMLGAGSQQQLVRAAAAGHQQQISGNYALSGKPDSLRAARHEADFMLVTAYLQSPRR